MIFRTLLVGLTFGVVFSFAAGKAKAPTVSEISVSGGRSVAEVYDVAKKNVPSLGVVYDQFLNSVSGFAGRVILELSISPEGRVEDCFVEESTTGVGEFDNMIRDLVSGWRFDSVDGENATAKFPIIFVE